MIVLKILLVSILSQPISYIESSTGLLFPEWDEGRTEFEFADINNDGNPDIVTIGDHGSPYINTQEHGIMVYFGDGEGNWNVYMNGNFGYGGIAVGDVNNDGFMDVGYGMHHNYSSNDFGDQLIEVALGDGSGMNWIPWDDGLATNGEDWGMFGTELQDFNNDGLLDIASVSFGCCAGVHVYLNNGDGTWTQSSGFLGGNSNLDITSGDFNGDGNLDLAVAHQYCAVYLGNGDGTFVDAHGNLPTSTYGLMSPSAGDVDNDGVDEFAFIYSGGVHVVKWSPGNQWTEMGSGLPTSSAELVELSNMDGDGYVDLVVAFEDSIVVYLGDGGTSWTRATLIPINGTPKAMRTGVDVDHNGRADIVVLVEETYQMVQQNFMRFFKEASPKDSLSLMLIYPRGGGRIKTMCTGAIRFIRWISEVPQGTPSWVKIEFANGTGNWVVLTDSAPNSGIFQWSVPCVLTKRGFLRITLYTPADSAVTMNSNPFSIVCVLGDFERRTQLIIKSPYPNPTRGRVYLGSIGGMGEKFVEVYGMSGRHYGRIKLHGNYIDLRQSVKRAGLYFLKVDGRVIKVVLVK